MSRAFIIASWGLIVALIIGATREPTITPSPSHTILLDQKCSDAYTPAVRPHCAQLYVSPQDVHADVFMRKVKRKARMVFA